jgi:hypothetical protein
VRSRAVHKELSEQKLIFVIQIIQPKKCHSFTSLLLDVYVWLNMFRVSPRPSSGAYKCTRNLWFNRWREAAGVLFVVVWQVMRRLHLLITCQTTTNNTYEKTPSPHNLPDHDQKHSSRFSPTVKSEAPSTVVCS